MLPHMIAAGNGGSIIPISSGAGVRAMLHLADYAASTVSASTPSPPETSTRRW
ncbi:MAG: hypothetical protein ACRDOI_24760 [Trebonia sp.]